MTPEQIALVQQSMTLVTQRSAEMTQSFYDALFRATPDARELFPADLTTQRGKFLNELRAIVQAISELDAFATRATTLGASHRDYGVRTSHYAAGGAALLEALTAVFEDEWTLQLAAAWAAAYSLVSQTMLRGGYEDSAGAGLSSLR